MTQVHFETPLCMIKRHKNRGRLELYIHDQGLREYVAAQGFQVISEDLSTTQRLSKKMLFKHPQYGQLLSNLLDQLCQRSLAGQAPTTTKQWLDVLSSELKAIPATVDSTLYESEFEYRQACLDLALQRVFLNKDLPG